MTGDAAGAEFPAAAGEATDAGGPAGGAAGLVGGAPAEGWTLGTSANTAGVACETGPATDWLGALGWETPAMTPDPEAEVATTLTPAKMTVTDAEELVDKLPTAGVAEVLTLEKIVVELVELVEMTATGDAGCSR